MNNIRSSIVRLIVLVSLTLFPSLVTAQWTSLPVGGFQALYSAIYFVPVPGPPRVGFITGFPQNFLYKTTNGGLSWTAINCPEPSVPDVADIVFIDASDGWLESNLGVFITADGGDSWSLLGGSPSGYALYFDSTSGGLFAGSVNGFSSSSDSGKTWLSIVRDAGHTGFAFSTDSIGLIAADAMHPPWYRTTDAGGTWRPLSMDSECWQPLAMRGTKTFFANLEHTGTILRSDDAGDNWRAIYAFPDDPIDEGGLFFNSTGCLRGDYCHMIAQTDSEAYLSTDQGNTWISLHGPFSDHPLSSRDQRFFVRENNIYMVTSDAAGNGALWELDMNSFQSRLGISEQLDNRLKQTTLHPGDSIGVTFVPGAGTLAATDSVTLTIRYDPNAVSLSSLTIGADGNPPWWIADSSTTCSADGKWCSLRLTLRGDSAEAVPDPLLHAEFRTYLTPSEQSQAKSLTYIYLDSAQSFFPQTTPCAPTALAMQSPDSVEIDFTGCGNSTILAAMSEQPPFEIESIVPNPAQRDLTVCVELGDHAAAAPGSLSSLSCQMFDALGNIVLDQRPGAETAPLQTGTQDSHTLHPIPYTLTLDVSALPSGIYFLRLSSNGYAVSRSVAIER